MGLGKSPIACDKCGHNVMWHYGQYDDEYLRLVCDLCDNKMYIKGCEYIAAKERKFFKE